MAFEVEHDWQGNLATPRPRIGERAKTRLLILLCAIWLCMGLIGHGPWKQDEPAAISIVKSMLAGENLLTPIAVGQQSLENPPLYYLSAAASAKLLSPILPMHDGARLITGIWMALTLLMVGMTGRELWGSGTGRQTTFIFIGSLGLIVTAHLLLPEVSALTGTAMGLYALALARRRPLRASALLGSGIGISFLSTGLLSPLIIVVTALLLPVLFANWRTRSYAIVLVLSALVAAPWLLIWPLLCWQAAPDLFSAWWHNSIDAFGVVHHGYFLNTLSWFSWPSLPLAVWGLWRYRSKLLTQPQFQLLLSFFMVGFVLIGYAADTREIYAMTLLLPLAALAGGSVESLKRGAAGALNWFGLMLFGIMGALIWLGWFAMMTGWPAKLAERMQVLSGVATSSVNWLVLTCAIGVTAVWLMIASNAKRSNRAAINDWAVGMTMVWSLLMLLWLPWIDSAKTYAGVMNSLKQALPANYSCITSPNLGSAQYALLDYYADIRLQRSNTAEAMRCDLYLVQDERGQTRIEPGQDWQLIWQGRRATDRRESFRLYQRLD